MEPDAVLRYFEPIDEFIKVRVFTAVEAANLFRDSHITNKRAFMDLVINACVVNCTESVMAKIDGGVSERLGIEDQLFKVCIEVNPCLEITRISIPVADTPEAGIHLLQHIPGPEKHDFRKLRNLEAELSSKIVGQPQAVFSVARALKKALTGLRDPQRPIAAFFFVGQTGVGKTELAKAISRSLAGDSASMVRVDGSEYALPHEYAKLLGAPPGYIGHDQEGLLSGLSKAGRKVVLFDEIEKSDSKVHDLLLQAMDEGFVTDSKSRRLPFGDAVLVMTSNLGAAEIEEIRNRIGFDSGRREMSRGTLFEETLSTLKIRFKPEFVNRLSEVVLFNAIGMADCVKIVHMLLEDVQRHAANVPIRIDFSDGVAPLLAEKGFKPEYGARELRRTVETDVEGPLSELLVDGRIQEGDRIKVRVTRDQLHFQRN